IGFADRPAQPVKPQELSMSLQHALTWLELNRATLLSNPDPTLWWMLARTDEILGGDTQVHALIAAYKARWIQPGSLMYPWRFMFDRSGGEVLRVNESSLPAYNLHFLYGLTCDQLLGQMEVVRAQNDAGYCPIIWLAHPHCRSHQLMGLLWAIDRGCD